MKHWRVLAGGRERLASFLSLEAARDHARQLGTAARSYIYEVTPRERWQPDGWRRVVEFRPGGAAAFGWRSELAGGAR